MSVLGESKQGSYGQRKQRRDISYCSTDITKKALSEYFTETFCRNILAVQLAIMTLGNDKRKEVIYRCVATTREEAVVMWKNMQKIDSSTQKHYIAHLVCHLASSLDVQNCLRIKDLAEQISLKKLKELAVAFTVENFTAVIESDAFTLIEISDLKFYLKSSKISHETSWQAVVKWVKYSAQRGENLLNLMDAVNIESFPFDFLLRKALQEPTAQKYTAAYFKLTSLVLSNIDTIREHISQANWFYLYNVTVHVQSLEAEKAQKVIFRFITENFDDIYFSKEFPDAMAEMMKQELEQKRRKKAEKSQKIDAKGGYIELHGCYLTFPPGALSEEKKITLSVDNNSENHPKGLDPIAPILGFKPHIEFDKPVTVEMKTWFSADEDVIIPVTVSSRDCGSEWKKDFEVKLGSESVIRFDVTHFCEKSLGIARHSIEEGKFHLWNDIYIQRETCQITFIFYREEKSGKAIQESMRSKNSSSFNAAPVRIKGKQEQKIRLELAITEPGYMEIKRVYQSAAFGIKEAFEEHPYNVIFVPRPRPRTDFKGYIEADYFMIVEEPEDTANVESADVTEVVSKTVPLCREWPVTLDPAES